MVKFLLFLLFFIIVVVVPCLFPLAPLSLFMSSMNRSYSKYKVGM